MRNLPTYSSWKSVDEARDAANPGKMDDKTLAQAVKDALRSQKIGTPATPKARALFDEQRSRMTKAWRELQSKGFQSRGELFASAAWKTLSAHFGGNIPGRARAYQQNNEYGDGLWHVESQGGMGSYLS